MKRESIHIGKKERSMAIFTTLLLILYIGSVLFLCLYSFSGSDIDLSKDFLGIPMDKVVHFCMFSPFPILFYLFLKFNLRLKGISNRYSISLSLLAGLFISTLFEASQGLLTTTRTSDITDLMANYSAIIAGTILVMVVKRIKSRLIS